MNKLILTIAASALAIGSQAAELSEWQSACFDDPQLEGVGSGNNGKDLPFNSGYKNTVCQLLYTAPMLQGLVNTAEGVSAVEISSFDLQLYFAGAYSNCYYFDTSIDFNVKVSATDATKFEKNTVTNKYEWFTQDDDAVTASGSLVYDEDNFLDCHYGMDQLYTLHVELDKPFTYEGGTILFTFESTSSDNEVDVLAGCAGFPHGSADRVSGSFATDLRSIKEIYTQEPQNDINKLQPVIKFYYTPVVSETPLQVATIENATAGVRASAAGDYNVLTFDFDIDDPSDCNEYQVLMGTASLGNVKGKHVSVSYLQNFATDQVFSIVPVADNVAGTSVTLPAGAFDQYFKAPANETILARAFVEYNAWDTESKTVAGAAKVQYTVDDDAAPVKLLYAETKSAVQSGAPEWCDEMKTGSSDVTAFEPNNGQRSFYMDNLWQTLPYRFGALQNLSAASLDVTCGLRYPLATLATPVLTADDQADANTSYIDAINKFFSPRIDPSAQGVFIPNVTYRDAIEVIAEGDGYYTFIAPAGHTIYFRFEPDAAPARAESAESGELDGFNTSESNIYIHNFADAGKGTLLLKSVDEQGAVTHNTHYDITEDGIASIGAVNIDTDGPAEYFTLQGTRVTAPAQGIYIRRQGTKAEKVIIR